MLVLAIITYLYFVHSDPETTDIAVTTTEATSTTTAATTTTSSSAMSILFRPNT